LCSSGDGLYLLCVRSVNARKNPQARYIIRFVDVILSLSLSSLTLMCTGVALPPPTAPLVVLKTCSICTDEKPASANYFFKLQRCGHELCRSCGEAYISGQIEQSRVSPLRCPFNPGCGAFIEDADIHTVVPAPLFEKLTARRLAMCLSAMADVHRCPLCSHAVTLEPALAAALRLNDKGYWQTASWAPFRRYQKTPCGADRRRFTCPACNGTSCLLCNRSWTLGLPPRSHDAISCRRHALGFGVAQQQNEQWVKSNSKPCPQCRAPITKDGGCNYMRCRSCQHEFCWVCSAHLPNHLAHHCPRRDRIKEKCLLM